MNTKTLASVANYTISAACIVMIGLTAYANKKQKQINADSQKLQEMMKPVQTCCNAPFTHDPMFCWK